MGFLSSTLLEIVVATTSPGLALAMQTTPPAPVVVDIRYRAPAGCPSESWFYSAVLGRVPHARRAEPGESARRFDVDVSVTGNESRASLEFIDTEGRRVERELHAGDCAEVVAGIAVVTAVAIDPRLAELERKNDAPASPPPAPKLAPRKAPEPAAPERRAAWAFGAHAGAVTDVAPVWAPSAEVFTELVSAHPPLGGRLAFGFADSGEFERDGATLRFWLLQGRLGLCPFPLELGTHFRVLPCVGFEAGAVHAESRESPRVVEPMSTTGIWLAVALAPSIELDVAGPFFLELQGLVRMPLLSRTYVLERPETVTYETPAIGFGAFLGLGARFAY